MKKILALLLTAVMCLSLAACGGGDINENKQTKSEEGSENTHTENEGSIENTQAENGSAAGVQVDEGLFNVDITMGKTFFEDMTEDEIKEAAKENGFNKCVVNEDGSVTYTMTKSKHEEMLNELKTNLEETVADMLEGEEAVASFVSIDYADDFSKFDIYVNDQYSAWDNLYVVIFYVSGAYYQSFAGTSADNIDVLVNFIDNETKENLSTASYRDWISNVESESGEESSSDDIAVTTGIPLAAGETITIADECEFYLDYADITDDVVPPKPSRWYSHYEAENGKTYVDICIAYKNLSTRDKDADEILNATLIYAGKYQYKGFSTIEEDNRGDFTYSSITSIAPLDLEYLHYLFEVPEIVESSGDSLKVKMNVAGNQYDITIREGADGEGDTPNVNATIKTSGSVKQGEIVAVMNTCEFQIDYTNITADVTPPTPDSWYSHYEADDGKVYVDFCVAYKNWETKDVDADDIISAVLSYAGKYEYNGFSIIEEDSRSDFTYSSITNIAPLSTEYLHYLFEVPAEVETSGETIEVKFTISGNTYSYKIR